MKPRPRRRPLASALPAGIGLGAAGAVTLLVVVRAGLTVTSGAQGIDPLGVVVEIALVIGETGLAVALCGPWFPEWARASLTGIVLVMMLPVAIAGESFVTIALGLLGVAAIASILATGTTMAIMRLVRGSSGLGATGSRITRLAVLIAVALAYALVAWKPLVRPLDNVYLKDYPAQAGLIEFLLIAWPVLVGLGWVLQERRVPKD